MAIEIVDLLIKNGDFPWQNVSSPEGKPPFSYGFPMVFPFSHGFSYGFPIFLGITEVSLKRPGQERWPTAFGSCSGWTQNGACAGSQAESQLHPGDIVGEIFWIELPSGKHTKSY